MKSILLLFVLLIPVLNAYPLHARFYYLPIGNSVLFKTDFSVGNIIQFIWDFGDDSPSFKTSESSVTHFYPRSTLWKVRLTVVDANNKQDSTESLVLSPVNSLPLCDFSVISLQDNDIILDASRSQDKDGSIAQYIWNLNEGEINISTNSSRMQYSYQKGGFYNISLVVQDNSNSYSTNSCWKKIFVNRLPIAILEIVESTDTHQVTLDASASQDYDGNIKTYIWDFGDGSPSQNQSFIKHDYLLSGTYNISLRVIDNLDNSSVLATKSILVDIAPRPYFDVVFNKDDKLILNANNRSWVDNDSYIVELQWDWNDGTSIIKQQNITSNAEHDYARGAVYNISLMVIDNFGKKGHYNEEILVNAIPKASFEVSNIINDTVKLKSLAYDIDGNISSSFWTLGDSSNPQDDLVELEYTFSRGGNYNVCLTVEDDLGAQNASCQMVFVNRLPRASFSIVENMNDTVTVLDDRSEDYDGHLVNFLWDWGDDTGATTETTHNYTLGGFYQISLTVIDDLEGRDTSVMIVRVNTPPTASYEVKKIENDTVLFDFSSSFDIDGIIETFTWDFGDGERNTLTNRSNTQAIAHTFKYGGEYNVTLTVTDNMNDTSSFTKKIFVDIPPTANFDIIGLFEDNWIIVSAKPFLLKGKGNTYDVDGQLASVIWNFGDTTANITNRTYSTQLYRYKKGGNYSIKMYAADNNGVISPVVEKVGVFVNTAPCPKFAVQEIDDGVILLNASESFDKDGSIITYCWNFNEGTEQVCVNENSTMQYAYASSGLKNISLSVIDNLGVKSLNPFSIMVTLNRSPTAFFQVIQSYPTGVVIFDITESEDPDGQIVKHEWDFGDGTQEMRYSPISEPVQYTYKKSGIFNVTLTVFDFEGLNNSITLPAFAFISTEEDDPMSSSGSMDPASEDFLKQTNIQIESIEDTGVLPPPSIHSWVQNQAIYLYGIVPNPPHKVVSYYWSFGDGGVSTEQIVSHKFSQGGPFNISLIVTDMRGNKNSSFKIIRLNYSPLAAFTFKLMGSTKISFDASNSFDIDGSILHYNWTFGDGQQRLLSTNPIFNYTYSQQMIYTVTLSVEDDEGAQSSFTLNVDLTSAINLDPILITNDFPLFGLLWHNQAQRYLTMSFNNSNLSQSFLTLQRDSAIQVQGEWVNTPNLMFYNYPSTSGYMIMNENNGLALTMTTDENIQISNSYSSETVFAIYAYENYYQFIEQTTDNNHLWSLIIPKSLAWSSPPLN